MKNTVEISINFGIWIATHFDSMQQAIDFVRSRPLKDVINTRLKQDTQEWDNF